MSAPRTTGHERLAAFIVNTGAKLHQLAGALRPGEARRAVKLLELLAGGQLTDAVADMRGRELVTLFAEACERTGAPPDIVAMLRFRGRRL